MDFAIRPKKVLPRKELFAKCEGYDLPIVFIANGKIDGKRRLADLGYKFIKWVEQK